MLLIRLNLDIKKWNRLLKEERERENNDNGNEW